MQGLDLNSPGFHAPDELYAADRPLRRAKATVLMFAVLIPQLRPITRVLGSSRRPTSTNYSDDTHSTIFDTLKDNDRAVMRFALRY